MQAKFTFSRQNGERIFSAIKSRSMEIGRKRKKKKFNYPIFWEHEKHESRLFTINGFVASINQLMKRAIETTFDEREQSIRRKLKVH